MTKKKCAIHRTSSKHIQFTTHTYAHKYKDISSNKLFKF